jgi:Ran GTPase-activating protein (RanGAP) involved in mRNA processing and transport
MAGLRDLSMADTGAAAAELPPTLTALTRLSLRGTHLGLSPGAPVAAQLASALGAMTALRDLDLGNARLWHDGARALAPALERLKSVTSLRLDGNDLRTDGAAALHPALAAMTALRHLGLANNNLTAADVRALPVTADALRGPNA